MSKPDPIKLPSTLPPVEPLPIPEISREAPEVAMRQARRRSGFRKTIITGALEPESSKKKLLG